jgi:hypothetical protein
MIRIKKPQDLGAAILFILLGCIALWVGKDYRYGTLARMGPGFFPLTLSWLLIGFGIVIGALSFAFEEGPKVNRPNWRGLALVIVAILLFGFMINNIGLLIAGFIVPLVAAFATPEVHRKEAIILSALLSIACVLVFVYGLRQPIPVFFGD